MISKRRHLASKVGKRAYGRSPDKVSEDKKRRIVVDEQLASSGRLRRSWRPCVGGHPLSPPTS